jgi:hypothetical protein
MNRDEVEAHMRQLEQLLDEDNPPLFAVVIRAHDPGMGFLFPLYERALKEGTLDEQHAVLAHVRAVLENVVGYLAMQLDEVMRAEAEPPRETRNVVDSL